MILSISPGRSRARTTIASAVVVAVAGAAVGLWWAGQGVARASAPAMARLAVPVVALHSTPAAAPAAAAQPAPPSALRIALVGLRRGRDARPIALLRVNGSPARAFVTGDAVSLGVRLQRVEPAAVVLQRGAAEERLTLPPGAAALPDPARSTASPPAPSLIAAPAGEAPLPVSPVERAIARARASAS